MVLNGYKARAKKCVENFFQWESTILVTTTGDTTYDNDDLDDAIFRSFLRFFCSFVHFFVRSIFFSKNRSRRCDDFGPKIVKIGAILAIFQPFKDFRVFHFL
mgnify:CR=1 FL=1